MSDLLEPNIWKSGNKAGVVGDFLFSTCQGSDVQSYNEKEEKEKTSQSMQASILQLWAFPHHLFLGRADNHIPFIMIGGKASQPTSIETNKSKKYYLKD